MKRMEQPTPTLTREDIERIIKRDFPEDSWDSANQIISEYGVSQFEIEPDRVRMGALKLANGDLGELKIQIENGKHDYRDIMMRAEYPLCLKKIFKQLTESELEEVYKKDWEQYEHWFRKK